MSWYILELVKIQSNLPSWIQKDLYILDLFNFIVLLHILFFFKTLRWTFIYGTWNDLFIYMTSLIRLTHSMENKEIIYLLEIRKTLNHFSYLVFKGPLLKLMIFINVSKLNWLFLYTSLHHSVRAVFSQLTFNTLYMLFWNTVVKYGLASLSKTLHKGGLAELEGSSTSQISSILQPGLKK